MLKKVWVVACLVLVLAVAACSRSSPGAPLAITSASTANATLGAAYSLALQATGGTAPYLWALATGSTLPAGLTLDGQTGVLSGTPTAAGASKATLTVADSSHPAQTATLAFTLTVNELPLAITTTALAVGTPGAAYSQALAASGGMAPYTWSLANGASLPAGLVLDASSGLISGIPAASGTSTVLVQVSDTSTPALTASQTYTLLIAPPPLSISAAALAGGVVGIAYAQTLAVSGGTPPYQWTIASGALPPGLTLAPTTGIISGTPTAAGTSPATIAVADASSPALTAERTVSIVVSPAPLVITTSTLANAVVGSPYSASLIATGGTPPYRWSLAGGAIPAGLALSAAGLLSGTPTLAGSSSFTVAATDASSRVATQLLTFTAQPAAVAGQALLSGQYFFQLDTFSVDPGTRVDHEFFAGSLTLDGNGNVTGFGDYSDDHASHASGTITGSYSLGSDRRGTLTLSLPQQGTEQFAIVAGSVLTPGGVATRAELVETDQDLSNNFAPARNYATGFLQRQDPTAFVPSSLVGNSVFGWSGDTALTSAAGALPQAGGLSLAGLLSVGSDMHLAVGSTADIATNLAMDTAVPLAGGVAPDTALEPGGATNFGLYGRATLTFSTGSYPNGMLPATSVLYILDATHCYAVSAPAGTQDPLYAGYLVKQFGSFGSNALNGAAIAYGVSQGLGSQANFASDAGTLALFSNANAVIARYSADGSGNLATVTDVNGGGTLTSALAGAATYSVAANGRVVFSGTAPAPILWLSGTNAGFATTQPSASGPYPTLLTLEPQTAQTYSTAALSGSFTLGVQALHASSSLLASGDLSFDGAGGLSATVDFFSDGYLQQFGSTPISEIGTYLLDSTGRGTLAPTLYEGTTSVAHENLVFYAISPTKAVAIDTTAGDQSPSIVVLQQ